MQTHGGVDFLSSIIRVSLVKGGPTFLQGKFMYYFQVDKERVESSSYTCWFLLDLSSK